MLNRQKGKYQEIDAGTKYLHCRFAFYCNNGEAYGREVRKWMFDQGITNFSDTDDSIGMTVDYRGEGDCWFNSHYFLTDKADIAFAFKIRWC